MGMSSTQLIVQIQNWDWPLHVGVKPRISSSDQSPDGGLLCSEAVAIDGVILSPEEHHSKLIQLRLYPLARDRIFDGREELDVGRLYNDPAERSDLGFFASLFLPADVLQNVLLCLSSKWKCIYLWVDDGAEAGTITDFGFSGDLKSQ